MMLFKLSEEKNLHFTTHNLNLQGCIRTQNREISLRTFKENVLTHLAITIQDFAFSISLRGGGTQTGSLTHLKHRGHNTTRRLRLTECGEDSPGCRGCDHWLTPRTRSLALCPRISTFPGRGREQRPGGPGYRGIGGGDVKILLYFANFSALNFNTWTVLMKPSNTGKRL